MAVRIHSIQPLHTSPNRRRVQIILELDSEEHIVGFVTMMRNFTHDGRSQILEEVLGTLGEAAIKNPEGIMTIAIHTETEPPKQEHTIQGRTDDFIITDEIFEGKDPFDD